VGSEGHIGQQDVQFRRRTRKKGAERLLYYEGSIFSFMIETANKGAVALFPFGCQEP
jgi:hypothetical protein